jgi:hypothetical protein
MRLAPPLQEHDPVKAHHRRAPAELELVGASLHLAPDLTPSTFERYRSWKREYVCGLVDRNDLVSDVPEGGPAKDHCGGRLAGGRSTDQRCHPSIRSGESAGVKRQVIPREMGDRPGSDLGRQDVAKVVPARRVLVAQTETNFVSRIGGIAYAAGPVPLKILEYRSRGFQPDAQPKSVQVKRRAQASADRVRHSSRLDAADYGYLGGFDPEIGG